MSEDDEICCPKVFGRVKVDKESSRGWFSLVIELVEGGAFHVISTIKCLTQVV